MRTLFTTLIAALPMCAAPAGLLHVNLAAPVSVGAVTLPAGDCTVEELSSGSDNVVLVVRSGAEKAAVLAGRVDPENHGKAGLVLKLNNGKYTLDQVWFNGEGFQLQAQDNQ